MTPLKILYICTHNRCRSALSEAITNQNGIRNNQQRLIAKSAGSAPAGQVHPLTLKYLQQAGYSVEGLTSNSWEDKEYLAGFEPDLLITVCDNAAGESCPVWLGQLPNLTKLHWGLKDPSKDTQDEVQTQQNFEHCIAIIEQRVEQLLQIAEMDEPNRRQALKDLVSNN
ncbi:arsenate reductase ArsC [Psychrobacter sp. FDAARGOS_221]|uniref:arsenate reductase ArsC n=1 Tax=Psychrobacter sp. FDAARGOS_221 TaxID=1975705 RepID=UPI000BB53655|nr:arsenate reductase ArsC [Psychrobacter sp. FDAARGOS_221]PNK59590.1 arsenate reductase ArsC [Psychrobacter sp. FDAARGOS_221]